MEKNYKESEAYRMFVRTNESIEKKAQMSTEDEYRIIMEKIREQADKGLYYYKPEPGVNMSWRTQDMLLEDGFDITDGPVIRWNRFP